jgi:hypothetical protein
MSRAVDLLEQGNSQTCILTLQTLLLQPRLPFFWRIHALTLLAHSVDDWFEAKVRAPSRVQPSPGGRRTTLIMMQTYQRQAEMLWRLSRRLLAEDVDHEFDRTLRINRGFLDQIAVELIEEMPDELRGLREEAEEGPGQVADGDKETCGNDGDGPDGEHDKNPMQSATTMPTTVEKVKRSKHLEPALAVHLTTQPMEVQKSEATSTSDDESRSSDPGESEH